MWWFIVKEKDGEDGHLHCVFISRRCVQRSNIISGYLKHPLADWDDASKENLRHWDVAKCTGAWKHLTSLNVITDYLSGNRESKKGDAYQVISSELPEDLSELEKYIPDVGELKRPKNIWCHTLHDQLIERFKWPPSRPTVPQYGDCRHQDPDLHVTEEYLVSCFKTLENEDIRDIMLEKKHLKIRAFLQWWNLDSSHKYQGSLSLDSDLRSDESCPDFGRRF